VTEPDGIKGAVEVIEPTRAERAIARRAAESRATVPDLALSVDINMAVALDLIAERSASVPAALVRASALALREHPRANGAYRDGRFELYSRINAGVVIPSSSEAATVLDADHKTIEQLTSEIRELTSRAAELTSPELSGATFTIAQYGVTRVDPLITPPHAVALAAGEVCEVTGVRDGGAALPAVLTLSIACDHRIVYPELAVSLLARIRQLLERAEL
jgi:pyruvate dehydrogenase E2 component (dihydrolipoyllysine-residue acetyltransferase)